MLQLDPLVIKIGCQLANRILNKAAGLGPLPDDHPADALSYRITQTPKDVAREVARWENYDATRDHPTHREQYESPSRRPPSRGPSIGF